MPGQLIFDGDCGFCRRSIARWRTITGDRGVALPYQEFAPQHPEIPIEEFRRAVQYIDEDGERSSGALAIFRSLEDVRGYAWLLWAYRKVPFFALASEGVYREIAGHRKTASWITRRIWGAPGIEPQHQTAVWLFRRVLAILFLISFLSFGVQVRGLIGAHGILPLDQFLDAVKTSGASFSAAPTIFWWNHSDAVVQWTCWLGAACSLVCAFSVVPRVLFAVIFILYLSLVTAGQVFMGYQWDYLLLECGFLAIFLTPARARVWLCQWLLFRLMFESGCVKLLSHDPAWANLTALAYHYETQPLPTPLAWYAFQLPLWFQKLSTALVFGIEIAAPFLMFGRPRAKHVAAFTFVSLQLLILLTGNYTCFNLLAIALCLFLLDDPFWGRFAHRVRTANPFSSQLLSAVLVTFAVLLGGTELADMFSLPTPKFAGSIVARLSPFGIVNSYGLFASMTTERIEIEVQGSDDGKVWQTYPFKYKPGDVRRAPPWVAPYQPRLDWQMWFAALGNYGENPWFSSFMYRLLTASPEVLALLERDPFQGRAPKFVRALAYRYQFSDIHDREKSHMWWIRELKGIYFPPSGLRNP